MNIHLDPEGNASTLFVKDQRTELFQLERTLGIRMERMQANGARQESKKPVRDSLGSDRPHTDRPHARRQSADRTPASSRPRMVSLPGEVLQVQMES